MLILGSRLDATPVMGLQTGSQLAHITQPIINPRTLEIVAYEVEGSLLDQRPSLLRVADIRELGSLGIIIDSSDEFVGEDDIIKLKELRDLHFNLLGLRVVDERKHKLGKITDYTIDTDSFVVQQLVVKGGLFNSLTSTGHTIHRSQIVKITDTTITVKSTEKKLNDLSTDADNHRVYSNPFRKPVDAQPETQAE